MIVTDFNFELQGLNTPHLSNAGPVTLPHLLLPSLSTHASLDPTTLPSLPTRCRCTQRFQWGHRPSIAFSCPPLEARLFPSLAMLPHASIVSRRPWTPFLSIRVSVFNYEIALKPMNERPPNAISGPRCKGTIQRVTVNGATESNWTLNTYPSVHGADFKVTGLQRNQFSAIGLLLCVTASSPCNSLDMFTNSLVDALTYSFTESSEHRCCPVLVEKPKSPPPSLAPTAHPSLPTQCRSTHRYQ